MSEDKPEELEQEPSRIIIDAIGALCDEHELPSALFIATDPKSDHIIMWYKGQELQIGKLAAGFVKFIKKEILKDLEI
jgi:hypothetical protein